ncbi:Respiratory supercomplex factor 1, mitochondrial [Recurvomyces mirabilis]|uniref:Respiratory supercomplex factor 1, mitochondrial n=1 Tax=Recurvomyces mirabilis TaxID=574656 RepID=A0AAE0WP55_9PEZI|nr:Respiratory supercomplex factor 1, mitochondrial [Recurvomyces mirabilis]KAK5158081.1 Respiratory supercomplex factor 1, mitochondrial [Recurvomyces mirabilis]
MSVPGNINTAPPPSSFDGNEEFYEESRYQKFQRKLFEEPLIPLGCALTCWALLEATRSIRSGDKHRTNRMFRRRIYAQGFTILAMVAGSAYWESDRQKRNQFNELKSDVEKKEKHSAWLRELEARQEEEDEMRRVRERYIQGRVQERNGGQGSASAREGFRDVKSVLEVCEERGSGPIMAAVRALWEGRR